MSKRRKIIILALPIITMIAIILSIPGKTNEKEILTRTAKIAAIGDIMMHSPQVMAARQPDGSYNFDSVFTTIKPYLKAADLTIANMEFPTAGDSFPYKGYPLFNGPDEVLETIKKSGIDVISLANNHALDFGVMGLIRTYHLAHQTGLHTIGAAPTEMEKKVLITEQNGIKVAVLAYTEMTNGIPVPKPHFINLIDQKSIAADIKEAKQNEADLVIAFFHFGQEYQRYPNDFQRRIAMEALEMGVDVVLGSHPHVLQPIEQIKIAGQDKYIVYSLGNFISNQFFPYTDEGGIVYLDIVKRGDMTKIKKLSFLPTLVHSYKKAGKRHYTVLPLEQKEIDAKYKYPGLKKEKWMQAWMNTNNIFNRYQTYPAFNLIKTK